MCTWRSVAVAIGLAGRAAHGGRTRDNLLLRKGHRGERLEGRESLGRLAGWGGNSAPWARVLAPTRPLNVISQSQNLPLLYRLPRICFRQPIGSSPSLGGRFGASARVGGESV